MKFILLLILLVSPISQASVESVSEGAPIQASLFNKISNIINGLLDTQIPTGENVYSARVRNVAPASITQSGSTNWITSCSNTSTGQYSCNINPGLGLVNKLNCTVSLDQEGLSACLAVMRTDSSSNSSLKIQGQETSRNAYCNLHSFNLTCQRIGSDYRPYKTIRQVLIDTGLSFLSQ